MSEEEDPYAKVSAEDRYFFRDGKSYQCLRCSAVVDDRLSHKDCCCSFVEVE